MAAKVQITTDLTKQVREFNTDSNGNFTFANVSPGTYTLKVAQTGFKTYEQKAINVGAVMSTNVGANQSTSVGGNQSTSVGGNQSMTIGGDQSTSVGGQQMVVAGKEIVIKCEDAQILLKTSGYIEIEGKYQT